MRFDKRKRQKLTKKASLTVYCVHDFCEKSDKRKVCIKCSFIPIFSSFFMQIFGMFALILTGFTSFKPSTLWAPLPSDWLELKIYYPLFFDEPRAVNVLPKARLFSLKNDIETEQAFFLNVLPQEYPLFFKNWDNFLISYQIAFLGGPLKTPDPWKNTVTPWIQGYQLGARHRKEYES